MLGILHGTVIEGKAPGIMLAIESWIAFLELAEHSDTSQNSFGGDRPIRREETVDGALEAEEVMGDDILEELRGPAAAGAMTGRNRTEDHREAS